MAERVLLQPLHVLHQRLYRDTSLLVEAISPEYGRLGLVARGARQPRSRLRGVLQPFNPLLVSWTGAGDLLTLTAAELSGEPRRLSGEALLAGFYFNELLLRLLHRHDPHPRLYRAYVTGLDGLQVQGCDPKILRLFEKRLLEEVGFGLLLEHDERGQPVAPDAEYVYLPDRGPRRREPQAAAPPAAIPIQGRCLLALAREEIGEAQCLAQVKRLLRKALARQLGDRPLRSRELLLQMRKRN